MDMETNQTPGGAKLTRLSALKRRRRLRRLRTAALALVVLAAWGVLRVDVKED